MAELAIAKFDVGDLTASELDLLKAAVIYGQKNRRVQVHTMSINAFCLLAAISTLFDKCRLVTKKNFRHSVFTLKERIPDLEVLIKSQTSYL